MKCWIIFFMLFMWSLPQVFAQGQPIGFWRDHLPYSNVIAVTKLNHLVYAATPTNVFTYNTDDYSIERLTKRSGISDIGCSALDVSKNRELVILGYNNGNVDLISETVTTNISSIKRSSINGDKKIYNIHIDNNLAYLACGFGIVVIDLVKKEVKDTYIIGTGGLQLKIKDVTTNDSLIIASTANGIKHAYKSNQFLSDFSQWETLPNLPLGDIEYGDVQQFNSYLSVAYNGPNTRDDSVYHYDGSNWQRETKIWVGDIASLKICGNNLLVTSQVDATVLSQPNNSIKKLIDYGFEYIFGNDCYYDGSHFWMADARQGLVRAYGNNSGEKIRLIGPYSEDIYSLRTFEDQLWVSTAQLKPSSGNNLYSTNGLYRFQNEEWTTYNKHKQQNSLIDSSQFFDFNYVAIDPNNPQRVFASSSSLGGLLEINGTGYVTHYQSNNSSLQERSSLPGYYQLGEASFDNDGNLWVPNSVVTKPLSVLSIDGTWKAFSCGAAMTNKRLKRSIVDKNGVVWIVPHGAGIFAYNTNNTALDESDDSYELLDNSLGNGNLPNVFVNDVVEDLDGEIWVATDQGPAVFYSPETIFNGGSLDAQQILIEQDGNIQILLETDVINAIAVDGANRKWMATQNSGVYLISEDGTEQIHHFTEENSPLISNEVKDIAINQQTGEVFFGTINGIVSYKGDATQGETELDNVYCYPNPVRPEHLGKIAIKGLARDSDVKITDISGNLVFETTSFGGQAIWDGNTFSGERVTSGIYLVFATDQDGNLSVATKIAFIQ